MDTNRSIDAVLREGLSFAAENQVRLYTVAFYLDHESRAISLCLDTQPNSMKVVRSINKFSTEHFNSAVKNGDLEGAALWQANTGRSLSLGDYAHVNIGRRTLKGIALDSELILAMTRALQRRSPHFLELSPTPGSLLFACSTLTEEVGLTWTAY